MTTIHKKIVVDEKGDPQEVIIPWEEFCQIVEVLGLDLEKEALEELRQADQDMQQEKEENFVSFDQLK